MIHPEIPVRTDGSRAVLTEEAKQLLIGRHFVRYGIEGGQPVPFFYQVLGIGRQRYNLVVQRVRSGHDGACYHPIPDAFGFEGARERIVWDYRRESGDPANGHEPGDIYLGSGHARMALFPLDVEK